MSLVMGLPDRNLKYMLYRMRLGQIKMLNARGYAIPEKFQYLLNYNLGNRAKFEQFSRSETPGQGVHYFSDVFTSSTRQITSVICDDKYAKQIIDDTIAEKVVSADVPSRVDLQIITTKVIAEYFPGNDMVILEVIPYHVLYIDPLTHFRASGWSVVLGEEEKQSVLESYRIAKVSFQVISSMDPLALQMGAQIGDIIRICSNNINSGSASSRILYREVS